MERDAGSRSFSAVDILKAMDMRMIALRFATPEETARTHRAYNRRLQRDFRDAALEALSGEWGHERTMAELKAITCRYHIHHKQPVWLGGDNNFENLVLISDPLHEALHRTFQQTLAAVQKVKKEHEIRRRRPPMTSLKDDLNAIPNVALDGDGVEWGAIHWPAGKCFVPELHARQILAQPDCEPNPISAAFTRPLAGIYGL